MFNTNNFLSDPILSDIRADIGDTGQIMIPYADTPNAGVPTLFWLATFKTSEDNQLWGRFTKCHSGDGKYVYIV